jgi:hypothetical protein
VPTGRLVDRARGGSFEGTTKTGRPILDPPVAALHRVVCNAARCADGDTRDMAPVLQSNTTMEVILQPRPSETIFNATPTLGA